MTDKAKEQPARDEGEEEEPPSQEWDEAKGGPVLPDYEGELE